MSAVDVVVTQSASYGRIESLLDYRREWKATLDSSVAGSVTLPPFWACAANCNCQSFPSMEWDPSPAVQGGQAWREVYTPNDPLMAL